MRAALLLFLVGCTHHRDITEAHEVSGDVEVSGQYGQTVKATAVAAPGIGVSFYDKATGGVVPPEEIYKVEKTSQGRGALEGFAIGGAVGGAIGAIVGYSAGDDDCNEDAPLGCLFAMSAGEKATLAGLVFGVIGGGFGALIGASTGSKTVYERKSAHARVVPVGPAGSSAGVTVRF